MTKGKVMSVIGIYRSELLQYGVMPADYPHGLRLLSKLQGIQHCLRMLDKMETFIQQDRMRKTFRWLGFIQGVLWAFSVFTLEDLMEHNRPPDEPDQENINPTPKAA